MYFEERKGLTGGSVGVDCQRRREPNQNAFVTFSQGNESMSIPPQSPKPRLILEQAPDGRLSLETYTDGNRIRMDLTPGFEMIEIREELKRQANSIAAALERKANREQELIYQRHVRVWKGVANGIEGGSTGHGVAFANRTVGKINLNARQAELKALEEAKTKPTVLADVSDLI